MASNVHDFADEIKAANLARLECFGRKLSGVYAACRYLGLFKTGGSSGRYLPGMQTGG